MRQSINVVDYDPAWATQFATLRSEISSAVGGVAVAIEHVGSTSVPGLAAKPIIDIDLVLGSSADVLVAIERLAAIGYHHVGNLGVEGREAFESPPQPPQRHVYVCVQGGTALQNHLMLRDFLRKNSDAAAEYGRLKKQLAVQFPTDIGQVHRREDGLHSESAPRDGHARSTIDRHWCRQQTQGMIEDVSAETCDSLARRRP